MVEDAPLCALIARRSRNQAQAAQRDRLKVQRRE
jgi:hypothetical protein